MRNRIGTSCALLLALALLAGGARADVIHYKDGRVLEGVIVERTPTSITVDSEFGRIAIDLDKIDRIEERLTPAQELAQRRAEIADGDAGALFQLALWAGEHDLPAQQTKLLREVIAADPDHARANRMLGRVQVEGAWLEPDEVEAYQQKLAEEKRAQGLLFQDGKWLPEDEVMHLRGMERWEGEWLPRREVTWRRNLQDLAGQVDWPARAEVGAHVTLYHVLEPERATALVAVLESVVDDLLTRLEPDDDEQQRLVGGELPIYVVPDEPTATALIDSGYLDRYAHTADDPEHWRGQVAFGRNWPTAFLVDVDGPHLDVGGDRALSRRGLIVHQLVEQLVDRFCGNRRTPGWVRVGLACWYEGMANDYQTLSLTGDPNDPDAPSPWVRYWDSLPAWRDKLRRDRDRDALPPLRHLLPMAWQDMDSRDAAVTWSLVRFLLQRHHSELLAYLRLYDADPEHRDDGAVARHERAWERAFVESQDAIDEDWRTWAGAQPPFFPENERLR